MRKIGAWVTVATLVAGAALAAGWNDKPDDRRYRVVINHEEQYSIWFADREVPKGWKATRFAGTKRQCLDHIEEVWTDMRPLSFRKAEGWGRWAKPDDGRRYKVVINHEEQYSIWFADRQSPRGWKDTGFQGDKQECLDYIEEVWTDMRPLSLRKHWRQR